MNKKEAIQAMLNGKKVRGVNWILDEYVYINDNFNFIENQYPINLNAIPYNTEFELYQPKPKYKVGDFVVFRHGYYRIKAVNADRTYSLTYNITGGTTYDNVLESRLSDVPNV